MHTSKLAIGSVLFFLLTISGCGEASSEQAACGSPSLDTTTGGDMGLDPAPIDPSDSDPSLVDAEVEPEEEQDGGAPTDAPLAEIERVRVTLSNGMPQRGPSHALVTIVVFSDFQCPFCSRVVPTIERIREEYGDDVRIVFRDLPLPFHADAALAAEAAREAFSQRSHAGFWQMHDLLFANQHALGRSYLEQYAESMGLDMARFRRALDDRSHQSAATRDAEAAARLGVRGTPAFFINGRPVSGAQPFHAFASIIDQELSITRAMVQGGVPASQIYSRLMREARAEMPAPAARRPEPDTNTVYRVPIGNAPVRGQSDALVTIVIFSDFECPFCQRVTGTLARTFELYGADVRFVFRNNPLPFHQNAMPAAEAALEAYAQRGAHGFWQMHDLLFADGRDLSRASLERYARQIGLDMRRFRRALDGHTHQAVIDEDQALARQLRAEGTPAFFINGRHLRGAQPLSAFQSLIDEELIRARARVAAGTSRASVYDDIIAQGVTPPAVPAPSAGAEETDRVYQLPLPSVAPTRGPADARVTIQVFSDFQCPFCARATPTIDRIVEHYGDRVRVIWRNYPLPFHDRAMPAAEAAMEVFAQLGADAFWRYHDVLFANQRALSRADLERYASELGGIDMTRFRRALDLGTHRPSIEQDMQAVRNAGAQIGTPSFFIEGRLIQGAQPFETFERAIDRALENPARD
jgi:protein-disulfide isomerase